MTRFPKLAVPLKVDGAAIYASTFDISEEIKDEIRDVTKVQLELSYESQSVETEEMLVIKVDSNKTQGDLPTKIFINVKRSDGGWESNKKEGCAGESSEKIEIKQKKTQKK